MIFLGLKFWPKVIFWVYERCQDFFWGGGARKKIKNFFLSCQKRTKGFFGGMLKLLKL